MKEENEEVMGCTGSCAGCHGCGEDHDHEEILDDGILSFVDEEGNDVRFEILDVITMDEKEYLVVLPVDEIDEGEEQGVLILEIKQEDGEEVYDTVTDDEEAEKVFKKFQEDIEADEVEDEE